MIPLTPDKLRAHQLGVTLLDTDRVAGYTGITSEYVLTDGQGTRHRALEVGGAVVLPEYRRRGLASAMLRKIIADVHEDPAYPKGTRLVAFTNIGSRGYMEAAGMVPLAEGESLSTDAFVLCGDCTQCPLVGIKPWEDPSVCCDADGIRALEL
jgi:ribosomal protein S18 acetylase RimI-like enzyme